MLYDFAKLGELRMITHMARKPEAPTQFTPAQLAILRARLDGWLAQLKLAESFVADAGDPLWIFRAKNLELGLKSMGSFFESLEYSLDRAAAGDPVQEDTRKTRIRAEEKLGGAVAAEAKQRYATKSRKAKQ